MKIIVSAGGTGGHIYPLLALINKFKEKEKNLEIIYIGTHNRMEKDLIPSLNIKYIPIEIYGFSKTNILRDFKNIFLITSAINKCTKIMKEFKPDVVIGAGGYVTMPVIYAAKKLKIKTVILEQNSVPGKTNKALSKNCDLVCTSYENSNKYFTKAKKCLCTGNPSGENVLNNKKITKESLGLDKNKKLVLVVAGSLGSNTINETFSSFLKKVKEQDNFEVLYITGKKYYDGFIKNNKFSKNVKILPYLDNMSGLFNSTDLIISRAGASTLSEIMVSHLPSIIIPSPYVANNHQYYNALDLKNRGVSIMILEKDLDTLKLYNKVKELMTFNEEYKSMKDNLKKINRVSSSQIIYDEIKELLK